MIEWLILQYCIIMLFGPMNLNFYLICVGVVLPLFLVNCPKSITEKECHIFSNRASYISVGLFYVLHVFEHSSSCDK